MNGASTRRRPVAGWLRREATNVLKPRLLNGLAERSDRLRTAVLARGAAQAEAVAVAGVVAAGALLRLVDLENFPSGIHGDESGFGLIALSILDGSGPHPFGRAFLDDPALAMYAKVPFVALMGPSIAAVRVASAIAGSFTVLALYGLARALFGRLVALAAAALLASSAAHIHFSRLGINFAEVPLFTTLSLLCIWHGYRRGHALWWLLGGMAAGLAVYFHFAARTFLLVPPLFVLYLLVRQRESWRRWVASATCLGLGVSMVLAPILVHSRAPWEMLTAHPTTRLIFSNWDQVTRQHGSTEALVVLWRQVERNVEGFVRGGDASPFYPFPAAPVLNEVATPLVGLGLALIALRPSDPRHALLSIWFWTMAIIGGVLTTSPPQFHRLLPTIPAALLAAALALGQLAGLATRLGGAPARPVVFGAAAMVPLAAGALDVHAYFGRYAATYPYADTTGVARFVAGLDPAYQVFVVASPHFEGDHATIQVLAGRGRATELLDPSTQLPSPPLRRPLAFVVFEPRRDALELLRERYPGGTLVPIERPQGRILNTAYLVPADPQARPWPAAEGLAGTLTPITATAPTSVTVDRVIAFRALGARGPRDGRPYRAAWLGQLLVPTSGTYEIELLVDGSATLQLDGREVLRREQTDSQWRPISAVLTLDAGPHPIALDYRSTGGRGIVELRWRPPGGEKSIVPPAALRPHR